jgi:hypothetical protein
MASSKNAASSNDRIAGAHQDNPITARKIPFLPFAGNFFQPTSLMVSLGNGHWCVSRSWGWAMDHHSTHSDP